ncbi:MAG TPA: Maf family protein [Chloroflexota bacterium]
MSDDPEPRRLILASGSPRRRDLLHRLGVAFEVVPSAVDERRPRRGEAPEHYALSLARDKVAEVSRAIPGAIVIGADTVVTIDGCILGKPKDAEDALATLRLLRGRVHQVITGVAINCGGQERADFAVSNVAMVDAEDDELRAYISTGEPMDKAGSYAVQERGARLVERVEGSFSNVVGLPLCLTSHLLEACGLRPTKPSRDV